MEERAEHVGHGTYGHDLGRIVGLQIGAAVRELDRKMYPSHVFLYDSEDANMGEPTPPHTDY
jgi:hypothetical protein